MPFARVVRVSGAIDGERVVFGIYRDGTDAIAILDAAGARVDGDASERWVDELAWESATRLRFEIRFDERTHVVTVEFRA